MKPFFKDLSIKLKLFLSYAAMLLIILSLSFSVLFFQVRGTLEQKIKDELNQSNQVITDMVETTATVSIKTHLKAIAQKNLEIVSHVHKKFLRGEISEPHAKQEAIRILLSQSVGDTGYIYCVNSKGVAVVHPRAGVTGHDFSHRTFVRRQMAEKEGYLEYEWKNPNEIMERQKALYMNYFEPWDWIISVASYKSEFIELININDFKDRILNLTFGETGYSFILNSKGDMVVHPELSGSVADMTGKRGFPVTRELIRLKKGYLTYWWKNPSEKQSREKFVAFDYIPDFDWIIVSSSYTSEVFSPLHEMRNTFLVILVLVLLVTGGVSLAISTTITSPLLRFVRQLEKKGQNDWSSRLDHEGNDEIGKLSLSFNRFMDRLDRYRKDLITEITVRKKAEHNLQNLKNYLADIIDSMPSALIGVDRNGNITQWNDKARQLTGISGETAGGQMLTAVLPRMSDKMDLIRQAIAEQRACSDSRHIVAVEGRKIYENITVYPLTAKGIEGAVIRIDDVTGQVRMEEMMVQSEKMLSVGGLAAGMAHEINNPLAGVIQNATLIKTRLKDTALPANRRAAEKIGIPVESISAYMEERGILRMIAAIHDSGLRAARIVDSMLNFARQSDADIASHCPVQLMDRILELASTDYNFKKKYDFKSIKIIKQYEDNLPGLRCEGSRIQQVLLNILNNGAQAMHEAKTKSPQFILRIHTEPLSEMMCMEIEDNGPGMDEATRLKVFDPFFTTKPVGVGTGLGLSVSYFIITESHEGTLEVISEPGKGANFIIRLPVDKK